MSPAARLVGAFSFYRPDGLLWLRGLAAFFVVCHHAVLGEWLTQTTSLPLRWFAVSGSYAVFIFFCISGYLIAKILQQSYSGQFGRYVANRALRILPVYYAAVGLSVWLMMDKATLEKLWPALFFVYNYIFISDTPASDFPNRALWSISTEVQFYLAVPIFLMIIRRMVAVGLLMVAIGITSKVYHYAAGSTDDILYTSLDVNLLFFGFGWLAWCWRDYAPRLSRTLAMWLVVASMAATWLFHDRYIGNDKIGIYTSAAWALWLPLLLSFVCAAVLPSLDSRVTFSKSMIVGTAQRILHALGVTSYSVYVIHLIIITQVGRGPADIALCYVAAFAMFVFVEAPFIALRAHVHAIRKPPPSSMRHMTDLNQSQWIDCDEALYNWWKKSGLTKSAFIASNRAAIEAHIKSTMNKRATDHLMDNLPRHR